MKRSKFIVEVLNSWSNTVFTTKEQVEVALQLFEKFGMFYCPIEDLAEFQLRTPKGWEPEDDSSIILSSKQ